MDRLFSSRRFTLAMLDAVTSLIVLFAVRFLSPNDVELVKQMIVILQPVIVAVIAAYTIDDVTQQHLDAKNKL